MSREKHGRQLGILIFLAASFYLLWVAHLKVEKYSFLSCSPPFIRHSADDEHNTLQANLIPETQETEPEHSKLWKPLLELPAGYGRVPFPLENVSELPTAFVSATRCRKGLNYMFFVHTALDHWEHRNVIRDALGNSTLATVYNWTTVFFVGLSENSTTNEKVREEAIQHGDMVVLPYIDTYKNLTYKYIYGIKWTIDNCLSASYNMKLDDDMVVNLLMTFMYLENATRPSTDAFHCTVHERAQPFRKKNIKWYVSKADYPYKYYPKHCTGGAVLTKSTVLQRLYNASFSVPFFWIDDVYVTGMVAKVAGVGHVDLKEKYLEKPEVEGRWKDVASGKIMLDHIYDIGNRTKAWKYIVSYLESFRANLSL